MKKLIILAITFVLVCCKEEDKGYVINAKTVGFDDDVSVYINAISNSGRPLVIDSTVIKNGTFKIKLPPTESKDFNYLTFKNIPGNVLYLAENNPIKMTIYKDSLRSSVIEGGKENQLFFEYIEDVKALNEKKVRLSNEMKYASKLKQPEKIAAISVENKLVKEEEKTIRTSIAKEHPNSLVSIMVLSDLINLKILPPAQVQKMYTTLGDSLKTTRLGKNLSLVINNSIAMSKQKKIDIGVAAEDFSAPTPDGKLLSLKESLGKVTIVDFWASWCKPCRMENPNVVRVYNKYHKKGLNIIGVSLDKKQEAWTRAIEQDNLEWNHVSNLKFWQEPIARAYGVRSIPATFILDEKGNVIAKNLRGPALESKISELLGG